MNTLKKGKPKEDPDSEDPGKKEDRLELKLPFDMRAFWKNFSEKFFRRIDEVDINEANHLVHLYSKYGILIIILDILQDHIFTKIGFPRTLNCLQAKSQDLISSIISIIYKN
jgi:hypothetical protein